MTSSTPLITTASAGFVLFRRLNEFLARTAKFAVGLMLAVNLTIVFAGVICRYVFGQPLGWVYEVAIFLMMWSAFVGSAALCRDKGHVCLDFLVLKLPVRFRQAILAAMDLAVIVFLVIVIQYSLEMINGLMASRSPYIRLPMVWVYSSVPVGMGLLLLQQVEHLILRGIAIVTGKDTVDPQA